MRIEVVRTGGFAGIERRAAVETAGHPDAPRLESLAAQALSAPPPPPERPPVPDGFSYTITAGPAPPAARTPASPRPNGS